MIVTGKSDSLTMSGSSEDARHVEKLRKSIAGDFIWFERDEKSYVIRDQATIDRARAFWAPQEELGKKQKPSAKSRKRWESNRKRWAQRWSRCRFTSPT